MNKWIAFVKQYRKDNNIPTWKEALQKASSAYRLSKNQPTAPSKKPLGERIASLPSELKYAIMQYLPNPHGFKGFTEMPTLRSYMCDLLVQCSTNGVCNCRHDRTEKYYCWYHDWKQERRMTRLFLQDWTSSEIKTIGGQAKKPFKAEFIGKKNRTMCRKLKPSQDNLEFRYIQTTILRRVYDDLYWISMDDASIQGVVNHARIRLTRN